MTTFDNINDFLLPDEINWFNWYWNILPNKIDTGQRWRSMAYYDQPFFQRIKCKLEQKVKAINANEEITTVNLNNDYAPGGIHSDGYIEYDKNDDVGSTYLIPIQIDCESYATVIFDYTSKKAVSLNDQLGLGNKGLVTYPQVTRQELGLSSKPFDKEIHQKYLKHLTYESLAGLTVVQIQHWKLGSAMIWPRENLHCSANFVGSKYRRTVLIATRKCN